ncbi:hypothetical protein KEF29_17750 [Streptomyces tuirus]|uniref:Uncharacterized protein n=1 Tax=Streptomyces tuirus TaxID=68278 RepID=A0A941J633_9ACTN|nr:hypothetical protein [Streptomyces tuirus]
MSESLGLPPPPSKDEGSKREQFDRSFASPPDGNLPTVARRILDQRPVDAATQAVGSALNRSER